MANNPLIELGLPIALMIIMAGMGLTLTLESFRRVVVYPKAMLIGTVAQVILIPLLGFAIIQVMDLSPAIAVGLIVIAACPGGTTSNVFTFLAKGNVALSIVLTVLASLITIATIPLFTNLALDWYSDVAVEAPLKLPVLRTIITLSVIIIIPVMVGMFLNARKPEWANRAEKFVSKFGLIVLAIIIGVIVYQTRNDILELLTQAGPAAIALMIGGIGAGFISGVALGVNRQDALTIAIEVGIKNGTLGLLVTLSLLQRPDMAIPSAVYGVLMFAFGGALVAYGRRSHAKNTAD